MRTVDEPLFTAWPRRMGTATIEPGSGQVRVKPLGSPALWLSLEDVRELAFAADPRRRQVLLECATEASRQESVRHEQMDGRV